MKRYNQAVIYVRNGFAIPAIVLKSAIANSVTDQASKISTPVEPYELLTLLYADPDNGVTLVNQGATAKIPQIAFAVKPFVDGAAFGWQDLVIHPDQVDVLAEHSEALANQVTPSSLNLAALKRGTNPPPVVTEPTPLPALTEDQQKAVDDADEVLGDTEPELDKTIVGPDGKTDLDRGFPFHDGVVVEPAQTLEQAQATRNPPVVAEPAVIASDSTIEPAL